MAFEYELMPPKVGIQQIKKYPYGLEQPTNISAWLTELSQELDATHALFNETGDNSFTNSRVYATGETQAIGGSISSADFGYDASTVGFYLRPVSFPTAGLQQRIITTNAINHDIHVAINAALRMIAPVGAVYPVISIKVEILSNGNYQPLPMYTPNFFSTNSAGVSDGVQNISLYTVIPNVLPRSTYRITALAGVLITTAITLPSVAQVLVLAEPSATADEGSFTFVVWPGG